MTEWTQILQREAASHALAGKRVCPVYALPHWVCATLHLITGMCRTITTGRFERITVEFEEDVDPSGIYRPWIAEHYCCPHDPEAIGSTYWSTAAASTLDVGWHEGSGWAVSATSENLARECVVDALRGRRTCPTYSLPCWVCGVLHLLTGTLRSVTDGRFERFTDERITRSRCFNWAEIEGKDAAVWFGWDRNAICSHHAAYNESFPTYWNSNEASEIRP